jgi:putative DNA primase/helicase
MQTFSPEVLASKLQGARSTPNGFEARCPAHDDKNASLAIGSGEGGRTLIHCYAGCSPEAICTAAGIKMADLYPNETTSTNRQIVETYDYRDEQGAVLFQVVRFFPKDFRQRRPDLSSNDGWTWSTKGVRRVLYRLPEVIEAIQHGKPILITEGEKDVAALVEAGFCATCNPGGAGKWLADYCETLRGADVVIVPDNDEPGRQHAELVAHKLKGVAKSVKTIALPTGKDAHDFLSSGGKPEQIIELIDKAAPPKTPQTFLEIVEARRFNPCVTPPPLAGSLQLSRYPDLHTGQPSNDFRARKSWEISVSRRYARGSDGYGGKRHSWDHFRQPAGICVVAL